MFDFLRDHQAVFQGGGAVYTGSHFTFLLNFVIVYLLHYIHLSESKVISHCDAYLHSHNDTWHTLKTLCIYLIIIEI